VAIVGQRPVAIFGQRPDSSPLRFEGSIDDLLLQFPTAPALDAYWSGSCRFAALHPARVVELSIRMKAICTAWKSRATT
jgi:hypothetical protein